MLSQFYINVSEKTTATLYLYGSSMAMCLTISLYRLIVWCRNRNGFRMATSSIAGMGFNYL